MTPRWPRPSPGQRDSPCCTLRRAYETNAYTASYDASGNMPCRAPDTTATCSGTPPGTGAQLRYDNEGRLSGWQNTPTSPTTSDSFLYDGAGNRVE